MKKPKIGHELKDNPIFLFSNNETIEVEPDYRDEKIMQECLESVFKLDKFLYDRI